MEEIVRKPISELKQPEINSRKHPAKQITEFKRSIEKFGVIRPIVADEEGTILVGNGLFLALCELGKEYADVLVVKGLSANEKKKLILSDNKIYSLGVDNYEGIEQLMNDLAQYSDFEIPGYDSEILDELYGIASVEEDAADMEKGGGQPIYVEEEPQAPQSAPSQQKEIKPTKATIEAREQALEEAKKFIICPHCGERVDLA